MSKSFHVACLEPGADNPHKHEPPPDPEPPEGFIDSTVYRYKLDEDGNKVLIGTMDAFPEGWDDPAKRKMTPGSGRRDKEEDEDMGRPKREAPPADELRRLYEKHNGKINRIARSLGTNWLRTKQWLIEAGIIEEQQTPEPKPAEAANQEPIQGSQEPAEPSVSQLENEVKETYEDLAKQEREQQGFGPEDDEPIPYQVAEDATLDEMKVIWIENVLTHCTQAKTQLQYIQAIMDLRV